MILAIIQHAPDISKESYGNYVIQHLLEKGSEEDKDNVVRSLQGRLSELSCHKFASNVIEKCIQSATLDQFLRMTQEIFSSASFFNIMTDKFGNFVI